MGRMGVAVVGAGYWGVNYVRMFSDLLGAENVLVCDEKPERLMDVAARFRGVETSTSLDYVLDRESVSAVVVCTPATAHFEVSQRVLSRGKHLLVEKPLTHSSHDGVALVKLASEQDLILMVGHTFIHNPAIQKIKSYIDRGDLGELYYLYAQRTNMGPIRHDVNAHLGPGSPRRVHIQLPDGYCTGVGDCGRGPCAGKRPRRRRLHHSGLSRREIGPYPRQLGGPEQGQRGRGCW